MSHNFSLLPSTICCGFTIDYCTNLCKSSVKSLWDLCLEKFVSNEFFTRNISNKVPHVVYHAMLLKAFDLERVLSIKNLMSTYPGQCFTVPVPTSFNNWSVFLYDKSYGNKFLMKPFKVNSATALQCFFKNVVDFKSQILTLDMTEAFISAQQLTSFILPFDGASPLHQTQFLPKTFTLKAGVIIEGDHQLEHLCSAKRLSLTHKNFKLELTALHIFLLNEENRMMELFKMMDVKELLCFSMEITNPVLFGFVHQLQSFSNLQKLCLQRLTFFVMDLLLDVANALNCFVHLKQLCLRKSSLSNMLRILLKNGCESFYENSANNSDLDCCMVHRGELEYLDLSYCKLLDDDLLLLQEFSTTASLKYLNLGGHTFDFFCLGNTIEKLGSSLVVLDLDHCSPLAFTHSKEAHVIALFSKFEALHNLKALNIRGISLCDETMIVLLRVIKKMPELRQIAHDPVVLSLSVNDEYESVISQKNLEVLH